MIAICAYDSVMCVRASHACILNPCVDPEMLFLLTVEIQTVIGTLRYIRYIKA